jgi:hypothetical protein
MKLGQLSHPNFNSGLVKLTKSNLPIKTAYKLKKLVEKHDQEIKKYEDLKRDLMVKYAKKNEEGKVAVDDKGNVSFDREEFNSYAQELNELHSIELEFSTIEESDLGNALDTLNLTVEEVFALEPVLKFQD